jgi:hypothetical protein
MMNSWWIAGKSWWDDGHFWGAKKTSLFQTLFFGSVPGTAQGFGSSATERD